MVAGNPWNGAALTYALGDRRSLFPHLVSGWDADRELVAGAPGRGRRGSRGSARRWTGSGVRWARRRPEHLLDRRPAAEPVRRAGRPAGRPGLREVDRGGRLTLYEVTACDAARPERSRSCERVSPSSARGSASYNGLAFLHPQWRLLYVSVPKAAGTSLNIALTRSAGIAFPGRFLYSTGEESLVSQTIWDGPAGGRPMVDALGDVGLRPADARRAAHDVFTVVRHPVSRLLSTWSSKYLVRAPYYRERIGLPDNGLVQFADVDAGAGRPGPAGGPPVRQPWDRARDGHLVAQQRPAARRPAAVRPRRAHRAAGRDGGLAAGAAGAPAGCACTRSAATTSRW